MTRLRRFIWYLAGRLLLVIITAGPCLPLRFLLRDECHQRLYRPQGTAWPSARR